MQLARAQYTLWVKYTTWSIQVDSFFLKILGVGYVRVSKISGFKKRKNLSLCSWLGASFLLGHICNQVHLAVLVVALLVALTVTLIIVPRVTLPLALIVAPSVALTEIFLIALIAFTIVLMQARIQNLITGERGK